MTFIVEIVGMLAVMTVGSILMILALDRDMKRKAVPYVFTLGLLLLTFGTVTLVQSILKTREDAEDAPEPDAVIRVIIENRTDGTIETKIIERKDEME